MTLPTQIANNSCSSNKKEITDNVPNALERFGLRKGKDGNPRIITLSIERIDEYVNNPTLFPSIYVKTVNKNGRIQHKYPRRDFRQNIVYTLQALLKHMDIGTLKIWNPKSQSGYTVKSIAKTAGIPKRSVERSMQALRQAGLITTKQISKRGPNDQFTAEPSIKKVSTIVFTLIGMKSFLRQERKKRLEGFNFNNLTPKTQTFNAKFTSVLKRCATGNKQQQKVPKSNQYDPYSKNNKTQPVSLNSLIGTDVNELSTLMNEDQRRLYNMRLASEFKINGKVTCEGRKKIIEDIMLCN
jgi:predicted transcriptional regulator